MAANENRFITDEIARSTDAAFADRRDPTGEDVEVGGGNEPLLSRAESAKFTNDWDVIQGDFVDRPREAVEQADRLVADLMGRLASEFSKTRSNLEQQWDGHGPVSTEELRVALTRYRTFFERLLAA